MPYVENQIVHDADSHLMELPDCLDAYFDPKRKADYHALPSFQHKLGKAGWADQARARQRDEAFRGDGDQNILLRKNYEAMGAFERADRPHALVCWVSPASWYSAPSALAISGWTRARTPISPMRRPRRTTG